MRSRFAMLGRSECDSRKRSPAKGVWQKSDEKSDRSVRKSDRSVRKSDQKVTERQFSTIFVRHQVSGPPLKGANFCAHCRLQCEECGEILVTTLQTIFLANIDGKRFPQKSTTGFTLKNFKFCTEKCSGFSPNFSRTFRALVFPKKRRPLRSHQDSPPFSNAKSPGKSVGKTHESSLREGMRADKVLKFPDAAVLNAVGPRNTHMSANDP